VQAADHFTALPGKLHATAPHPKGSKGSKEKQGKSKGGKSKGEKQGDAVYKRYLLTRLWKNSAPKEDIKATLRITAILK